MPKQTTARQTVCSPYPMFAAILVFNHSDQLLLVHNSTAHGAHFELPSGRANQDSVQPPESTKHAAIRLVREFTGLLVTSEQLMRSGSITHYFSRQKASPDGNTDIFQCRVAGEVTTPDGVTAMWTDSKNLPRGSMHESDLKWLVPILEANFVTGFVVLSLEGARLVDWHTDNSPPLDWPWK